MKLQMKKIVSELIIVEARLRIRGDLLYYSA